MTGDPETMPQFFPIIVAIRNRDSRDFNEVKLITANGVVAQPGSETAFAGLGMVKTCAQHSHCSKDDVFSGKNCDEPTAARSPSCRHVTAVVIGLV